MTDENTAATSAPETGNSDASAPAPAPLTKADLESIIDAKLSGLTSKYNGELASLRKALKTKDETSPSKASKDEPAASAAPAPVTFDDLSAFREIGRLEARLGDALIEALGEEYSSAAPKDQLRMLRQAERVHKLQPPKAETAAVAPKSADDNPPAAPAANEVRGETPARTKQNVRGEPPAPRDGAVPRPTTRREYESLPKEKRALLMKDPSFDPLDLPRR